MTVQTLSPPAISSNEALRVAVADAQQAYSDLHLYHIALRLGPGGWRVDFEFKDEDAQSGGPHYLIDSTTGTIKWKQYEQ